MKLATRQATINQLNATHFDNAVTMFNGQARGFGVEDDLAHERISPYSQEPCL